MAIVDRNRYNDMLSQAQTSDRRRRAADQELTKEKKRLDQLKMENSGMSAEGFIKLQEKIDSTHKEIQKELNSLERGLREQFGEQELERQRALESVRHLAENNRKELESINEQIEIIEKRINDQIQESVNRITDNRKQALIYYDKLLCNIKAIMELYPEKYEALYSEKLPTSFRVLKSTIESVDEDIKNSNYEVAIGLAQTRLQESFDYLVLMETYHATFLNVKRDALNIQSRVLDTLKMTEKEKKTTIRIDETEYIDDHGMTYWAREMYQVIKHRVAEVSGQLEFCLDSHDVKAILIAIDELEKIDKQVDVCRLIEDNERNLHYTCCERVAQIYDALSENDEGHWRIEENKVSEDDLRNPVYAILSNSDDFRLTIACIPERNPNPKETGTIRCEIEVFDHDGQKNDLSRCEIIYNNIISVLSGFGIAVTFKTNPEVLSADSKSFVDGTFRDEQIKRDDWIKTTRRTIGL